MEPTAQMSRARLNLDCGLGISANASPTNTKLNAAIGERRPGWIAERKSERGTESRQNRSPAG